MKNTKKTRWLAGLTALLLLAGCAGGEGDATTTTADATTTTVEITTTTAAEATTTQAPTTTTQNEPVSQGPTSSTRKTVTTKAKTTAAAKGDLYPITRTMTPQQAAAAVKHVDGMVFTKIAKETAAVTQYDPKLPFAHHTGVTYFKGKLYGMFSQHGEAVFDPKLSVGQFTYGEDYPGQCLSIASSSNFYDWSKPQIVVKAWKGVIGDVSIIPCGIYAADDKLFVTFMAHDFGGVYWSGGKFAPVGDDSAQASTSTWMCYSTDGVNWSDPAPCGALVGQAKQIKSGRWWNGGYYSDKAKPDGFFWEMGGITGEQIADAKKRGATIYTERSWYENKDGILFDMARTDTGVMWLSQSYDGGDTWSDAYPTNFTSDNNQFPMTSLLDGRVIAVGSPGKDAGGPWDMWPLNLYISADGYNFDKAYTISDEKYQKKNDGYSKGGSFGYPKLMIEGNYLYVYHSKMKEVIEIHRIKLSDIE